MENRLLTLRVVQKLEKKRESRTTTHRIYRNRFVYGEFHHLYLELRAGESSFRQYTRMTIKAFDYIVEKVRSACYHFKTNFKRPISFSIFLYFTLHVQPHPRMLFVFGLQNLPTLKFVTFLRNIKDI
nr:unnamed protein product [Callosobruchus analis]